MDRNMDNDTYYLIDWQFVHVYLSNELEDDKQTKLYSLTIANQQQSLFMFLYQDEIAKILPSHAFFDIEITHASFTSSKELRDFLKQLYEIVMEFKESSLVKESFQIERAF